MTGTLGVNGGSLGWPLCVRTGVDFNFGFYGSNEFGCINDAGSAWQAIRTPSSLSAGGDLAAGGNVTAAANVWTGATVYFRGNGGLYLTHDGGSTFVVSQNFQAYGNVTCNAINTQGNRIDSGGHWGAQFTAQNPSDTRHFELYNTATGHLRTIRCQGGGEIDFVNHGYTASTQTFRNDGEAWKPNGGYWAAVSDARIKDVVEEYTTGLDAIIALRPVRFIYKGNDSPYAPPVSDVPLPNGRMPSSEAPYLATMHHDVAVQKKVFIGLVAQEAEVSMPELVASHEGWIDNEHVDDLRVMDMTPTTFALINAVKELKAIVDAQAARIAALEAANGV
jgi:hypothetical protein